MTPNDTNLSDSPEEKPDSDNGNGTPFRDDVGAGSDDTPTVGTGPISVFDIDRRSLLKLVGGIPFAGGTIPSLTDSVRASSSLPFTKLTASDPGTTEFFGISLALDRVGDTVLIGAEDDGSDPEAAGGAYVFQYDASTDTWSETQKLVAPDREKNAEFGASVALTEDGDLALVGAPFEDGEAEDSGAVYYFTRGSSEGSWTMEQRITPDSPGADDHFGAAHGVSLDQDATTAAVGASGDNVAYVFDGTGSNWDQEASLVPDEARGKSFGSAVELADSGVRLAVGDEDEAVAYVFNFDTDDGWTQTQRLAGDTDKGAELFFGGFGFDMAFSEDGDTLVVGDPSDSTTENYAGAAFVFEYDSSSDSWTRTQKLTASDGRAGALFGDAVAIAAGSDTILVGAEADDEKGNKAGAVYLYEYDSNQGQWTETTKQTSPDADPQDNFGDAVGLSEDGDTAVVGAAGDSEEAREAGAAYATDPSVTIPSITLSNVRPIQVVENTILRNPSGSDDEIDPQVPDLVAGRETSVLFDLQGSTNLDQLPSSFDLTVSVVREYEDQPDQSDSFQLSRDPSSNDRHIRDLADPNTDEAQFFEDELASDVPVFEPSADLRRITVDVDPDIDDDGAPDLSGSAKTVNLVDGEGVEIESMDRLDVGFIEIADPEDGDNYGDENGHIKDDFDELVDEATDYLESAYPVDELTRHEHPDRLDDSSVLDTSGGSQVEDLKSARSALEDEFSDVDFDVTVAFVPEGFPDFHDDGYFGVHVSGVRAAAAVRGDLREDIQVDELHTTTAQEVGHHFFDTYPDELSMRQGDGDIDNTHARTEPDGSNDTDDDKFIDSTGFDLTDGSYAFVGHQLESFMSYNFDEYPTWADTHVFDTMLDTGLEPHSSGDGSSGRSPERILEGVGRLATDDTTTFSRLFKTEGFPMPSIADGAVTVTVVDGDEETIDSRTFPDEIEIHRRVPETNRSHSVEEDVVAFAVPFPEEAAAIEVERNGTVTRLNPVERSLREAIHRLPDAAFKRDPDDRRDALHDKLDSIDEMMAEGNYHPAKRKMEKDIRDKIEKWLRDDYETGPLQPTKEELLALVDEMIAQLETLAQNSGNKGSP